MPSRTSYRRIITFGVAAVLSVSLLKLYGRSDLPTVQVGSAAIGGVVNSSKGPEAGVWVIAETSDLPTKFVKIVVTDDQGRYLIPDLPAAQYKVWVRGYGLVDSSPIMAAPGEARNLTAKLAPDPHAAAQYYPASYWYSLLDIPPKTDFPGTGPSGNGISTRIKSQAEWVELIKTDACESCHQLGDKATRTFPETLGHFDSSVSAWSDRVSVAQVGAQMNSYLMKLGRDRALGLFADWTDRIANGEYPKEAPPRPQGIERNVVITEWDWGTPKEYFHDMISTDRRNPNVNASGPIYGVHEASSDNITILDPNRNSMTEVPLPITNPNMPFAASQDISEPSPYWGNELIWKSKANAHSLVMDSKGRIWTADPISGQPTPESCRQGNPFAATFPLTQSTRQSILYDPATRKFTVLNLCFDTQHLMFAEDANNTLWFSNDPDVVGWLNTKKFDETHDVQKSQGWIPLVLDTNGNGKRDDYVEPDKPVDPTKDKRIKAHYYGMDGFYGINPSPVDGSIWGSILGYPGAIVHVILGSNPPSTSLAEFYQPPLKDPNNPGAGYKGYSPRGMDIDRNGVVWTVLASGHFASFDRRKCKGTLNGPTALGQQCPEGWTLYQVPGPLLKGSESIAADTNYYDWVDQFDTFGLGKNVPIATGNGSDALLALPPDKGGKFVVMRVPYPMGFFAKNMDARIDDPKAGWKGRGLWSTYATRAPQHIEGGKGTTSKVVKFQLRPNPLAD